MYYFYYNLTYDEILRYLINNTQKDQYMDFSDYIYLKIKRNNIKLRKKKLVVHPLQRRFIGKIIPINNNCLIIGEFKSPLLPVLFFSTLIMGTIIGHIECLVSSMQIIDKIYGTSLFIIMYLVFSSFFITRKIWYVKQEADVLTLLNDISVGQYKD